jgi:hypothetical protein
MQCLILTSIIIGKNSVISRLSVPILNAAIAFSSAITASWNRCSPKSGRYLPWRPRNTTRSFHKTENSRSTRIQVRGSVSCIQVGFRCIPGGTFSDKIAELYGSARISAFKSRKSCVRSAGIGIGARDLCGKTVKTEERFHKKSHRNWNSKSGWKCVFAICATSTFRSGHLELHFSCKC